MYRYKYVHGGVPLEEIANQRSQLQNLTEIENTTVLENLTEPENLTEAALMSITKKITLSSHGYLAISIYLIIVGICATVGNIIVIVTIVRNRPLHRKPQVLLLLNLAVADLGISVTGYPYTTSSSYAGRWLFGDVGCQMYAFTCFFLSMGSMDTLAAISIYRYIVIVKPKYQKLLTNANTVKVIAAAWIYALLLTFPPLVGWSYYTYESFGTSCSMNWLGKDIADITYLFTTVFFCYISHVSILSFCYINIVKHATNRLNRTNNGLARKRLQKELRTSLMCFIMVFCFIMVWTPYAAISIAHAFGWMPAPWVLTMPTMFAKSSCVINPIIYTFLNVRFRRMMAKIWCKCLISRIYPLSYPQHRRPADNVIGDLGIFNIACYNKEGVYLGRQDDQGGCWADLQETAAEESSPQMVHESLNEPPPSPIFNKPPLLELSAYDLHQDSQTRVDIHQEEVIVPTDEFEDCVESCQMSEGTIHAKSLVVEENIGPSNIDLSEIQSHYVDGAERLGASTGGSDQVESPIAPVQDHLSGTATCRSIGNTNVPFTRQSTQMVENPRIKSPEAQNMQHPRPSSSGQNIRPSMPREEQYTGSAHSSESALNLFIESTQVDTPSSQRPVSRMGSLSKSKWSGAFSRRKQRYQLDEDSLGVSAQTNRLHQQAYLHSRHMITSLPFTPQSCQWTAYDEDTFYDLSHASVDGCDAQESFEMKVMRDLS